MHDSCVGGRLAIMYRSIVVLALLITSVTSQFACNSGSLNTTCIVNSSQILGNQVSYYS